MPAPNGMTETAPESLRGPGVTAALVGLTAPHSSGWRQTLRHCPTIDRFVVCDHPRSEAAVPPDSPEPHPDAAYSDVGSMLASENLDFALISVRNDEAPELGSRFLSAGIPVIIEKPAARTSAEIQALIDLSRRTGVPWCTGFLNRFLPAAQEFRQIVGAGALGRVVSIEARMVTSSVAQRGPDHWLFQRATAGGGILHWLAIHSIDLIRYITGLEFAQVSGHVATLSDTGIDVEDMAAVSFTMSNGAVGNLHAGYVLRQRYGDIGMTIRGTLGEVVWPMWDVSGRRSTLQVHSDAPGWESVGYKEITVEPRDAPGYGGSGGIEFVSGFIRAAAGGDPFITDGDDALKAMQFVEAAYAASRRSEVIAMKGGGQAV